MNFMKSMKFFECVQLMPMGASPLLLADEESIVGRRAVFASKHLWVTPHSDSQRFPAGDYVMQANDCRGLALWTKEVSS
jgi:primary-amine oxidase